MKVGLLGGSFDPAHLGHVFISLEAMRRFGLNQVWWLITKQNPLKGSCFYPIERRVSLAEKQLQMHRRIKVFVSNECNTYSEVSKLQRMYLNYRFTWIMGIDCMLTFHKWYKFQEINKLISIIAFNRGQLIHRGNRSRISGFVVDSDISNFSLSPGKFCIVKNKTNNISSTMIKAKLP